MKTIHSYGIVMVKRVGWDGYQGISRAGPIVLARVMESQVWHLPACSVTVGGGLRKTTMASIHLSVWKKAVSQPCLDTRHFGSSLYATGAFQASALVLELRGCESE